MNVQARELQRLRRAQRRAARCADPEEIVERIKNISVYMARSGEMLAQAKRLYNQKTTSEIGETIVNIAKQQFLSATAQNALVKSIADEEQYLVDWIERIKRTRGASRIYR